MTDAEKSEKVIQRLEQFINNYKRYITDWEPVTDALSMLRDQEPITPCIRGEEGFSYNDSTRQYGCGSCGKPIDRGDEFCRHCGKAVKWYEL